MKKRSPTAASIAGNPLTKDFQNLPLLETPSWKRRAINCGYGRDADRQENKEASDGATTIPNINAVNIRYLSLEEVTPTSMKSKFTTPVTASQCSGSVGKLRLKYERSDTKQKSTHKRSSALKRGSAVNNSASETPQEVLPAIGDGYVPAVVARLERAAIKDAAAHLRLFSNATCSSPEQSQACLKSESEEQRPTDMRAPEKGDLSKLTSAISEATPRDRFSSAEQKDTHTSAEVPGVKHQLQFQLEFQPKAQVEKITFESYDDNQSCSSRGQGLCKRFSEMSLERRDTKVLKRRREMGLKAGMNKSLAVLPASKRNGVRGGTRCADREVKKELLQKKIQRVQKGWAAAKASAQNGTDTMKGLTEPILPFPTTTLASSPPTTPSTAIQSIHEPKNAAWNQMNSSSQPLPSANPTLAKSLHESGPRNGQRGAGKVGEASEAEKISRFASAAVGRGSAAPAHRSTQAKPFNLSTEARGVAKRRLLDEQIAAESGREEAARLPRANPLPWTLDERQIIPKPSPKKSTKVKPFDLLSVKRHQKALEQQEAEAAAQESSRKEAARFRARPVTSAQPAPLPPKQTPPATVPQHVVLKSNERAEQRRGFDKLVAEKHKAVEAAQRVRAEERDRTEKEEIRKLRREAVIKARPAPKYDIPCPPPRTKRMPTLPNPPNPPPSASNPRKPTTQPPTKPLRQLAASKSPIPSRRQARSDSPPISTPQPKPKCTPTPTPTPTPISEHTPTPLLQISKQKTDSLSPSPIRPRITPSPPPRETTSLSLVERNVNNLKGQFRTPSPSSQGKGRPTPLSTHAQNRSPLSLLGPQLGSPLPMRVATVVSKCQTSKVVTPTPTKCGRLGMTPDQRKFLLGSVSSAFGSAAPRFGMSLNSSSPTASPSTRSAVKPVSLLSRLPTRSVAKLSPKLNPSCTDSDRNHSVGRSLASTRLRSGVTPSPCKASPLGRNAR